MDYTINLSIIRDFLFQDPFVSLGEIIRVLWWLIPATFIPGFYYEWRLNKKKAEYEAKLDPIILAIDVPQETEPNLKAVEQIFAQFAGIKTRGTLWERFVQGKFQPRFSLEVISLDGYVQFLIWTPSRYRDLIESAIYAQYPDAEISQVEDYTKIIPFDFDREKYSIYGTEFKLTNKDVFPIRTYIHFEHSLSQQLADPMAALLEILSKLRKGEQIWLQMVISPASRKWKDEARRIIEQIISGKKSGGSILDVPRRIIRGVAESFTWFFEGGLWGRVEEEDKEELLIGGRIMNLTPGDRAKIEAIEQKIAKLAFKTKFRMIYFADKEVFEKGRGVSGVIGSILQFNTLDLNGFEPDRKTRTKVNYFFVDRRLRFRERRILRRFKKRWGGARIGFVLNTEELASVYHFPVLTVKAPLVKRTEAKRGGPPVSLPTSGVPSAPSTNTDQELETPSPESPERKSHPPDNLPV